MSERVKATVMGILLAVVPSALPTAAEQQSANALVLMDSSKPSSNWAEHNVIPYLDHFGVPYHAVDVTKRDITEGCWNCHALMIVAHPQAVAEPKCDAILKGVEAGGGVLSFDPDFPKRAKSSDQEDATVLNFNTDHYITSLHKDSPPRKLLGPMSLPKVTADESSVLVKAGDAPLLIAEQIGQGRIVQWTTQAWMSPDVLGPLGGLDDCLWHSIVWAARKPFAMRHLPPIVTMRVDDVAGRGVLFKRSPLYWIQTCGKYGFKPWLGLFIYNLTPEAIEELRGYIDEGIATASPHAFGRPPRPSENKTFYYDPDAMPLRFDTYDEFIYFHHDPDGGSPWSDAELARGLETVDEWYAKTKLPMSTYFVAHYYETGRNAIPHVTEEWHMEFAAFNQQPGLPYSTASPWIKAGPFRLHGEPGSSAAQGRQGVPRPVCYADFVDIDGRKLFNCFTEIRDDAGYEWAPDNNVEATVGRGVRQLKRALDAKVMAVLFTHETDYIYKIRPENWDKELKAVSEAIADYDPISMTTDDALKIVRAYKMGRLTSCTIDADTGKIKATLKGSTDVPTSIYIYSEQNNQITPRQIQVPVFSSSIVIEH